MRWVVRKNYLQYEECEKKNRTGVIEMGLNKSSYTLLLTENPPSLNGTLKLKVELLVIPRWASIILRSNNGDRGNAAVGSLKLINSKNINIM